MPADSLRLLEFGKVKRLLAAYAVTSRGKRLAEGLEPMPVLRDAAYAVQETSEMARAMAGSFTLPIGPVEDVSLTADRARAGGAPLEPQALWRVAECLSVCQRVARSLQRLGSDFPALLALGHSVPECPELIERIRATVDTAGLVLDGASAELKAIRGRIRALRRRIEARLAALIKNPSVRPHLQYENPTMCRDRYVLPVNAYRKSEVRGIVHGSSDSGATLYVEPMQIIDMGNELAELLGAEDEEVERILWELTRAVGSEAEVISLAVQRLAEADLVRAKATMSAAFTMNAPAIGGPHLELREARHPLLLYLTAPEDRTAPRAEDLEPGAVVPLDVHLGQDFRMLILTGPNTGGKTVVLKTVGLLCLMARSGMHVPAVRARIPDYDSVFVDIGDEQSLEQSLSTFSSHMSRIIRILDTATETSLVLLDELGAGTDPAEGSALGGAILKRLLDMDCQSVVVTHLGKLKTFAVSRPGAENASMDFDARTLRPCYHLTVGTVGSSNALEIAERLGLPPALLADARDMLDSESEGEYSSMLDEVRLVREDVEQRRDRVQYLEQEAERLKGQYEEAVARLKAEEDRRGADLGLKMRERLQGLAADAERLYEDMRYSHKSLARRVRQVRNGLRGCLDDLDSLLKGHKIERPLKPGDEVYVMKVHKWGTIEKVDRRRERVKVRVGNAQMELPVEDVQPWGEDV
jgi:DNA mismatch repair protein MutS2